MLNLKVQVVVIDAAWIKRRCAQRTGISAVQILGNRQRVVAVAAEYGVGLALVLVPDHRHVVGHLLVALETGVKRIATLESDSNNVALRVVVRALTALIDAGAVHNHRTRTRSAAQLVLIHNMA